LDVFNPLISQTYSASVISSACSLQATPVTTVSSVYTTTTATYTSGEIHTTTVLATSTVSETTTVVSTTTIQVASGAPTEVIGYLTFSPEINAGADYCLSDDSTHMTDNYYQKSKRETFILTADGYLYSVSNDSYYYITGTTTSTLLYWTRNKAIAMPIFSAGQVDSNGHAQVFMKDVSTGNYYNYCLSTAASYCFLGRVFEGVIGIDGVIGMARAEENQKCRRMPFV
jgi:hypothetical protein